MCWTPGRGKPQTGRWRGSPCQPKAQQLSPYSLQPFFSKSVVTAQMTSLRDIGWHTQQDWISSHILHIHFGTDAICRDQSEVNHLRLDQSSRPIILNPTPLIGVTSSQGLECLSTRGQTLLVLEVLGLPEAVEQRPKFRKQFATHTELSLRNILTGFGAFTQKRTDRIWRIKAITCGC